LNGYKNSRVWDTAFAASALQSIRIQSDSVIEAQQKAVEFLVQQKITQELPLGDQYYRSSVKGGYPFCDAPHPWPVTDSTAEALAAILGFQETAPLAPSFFEDTVDFLLGLQNRDGGWATFECTRTFRWLEKFDLSCVFGKTMIDYSYTECCSSCIRALLKAKPYVSAQIQLRIDEAAGRAQQFLLNRQRIDGSWLGSWGVCFTYGTWFGVWGLRATGIPEEAPAIQQAGRYLQSIQLPDGGWGEKAESCKTAITVPTSSGQSVATAWALLALARCGNAFDECAHKGLAFLKSTQNPDGSWPDSQLTGAFNRTCTIRYDNYASIFPFWALAEWESISQ